MAGGGGGDGECNYSCKTASETLEWIHGIIDFLESYRFFLALMNLMKCNRIDCGKQLMESGWISVEKLQQIPFGVVQAFEGVRVAPLNKVISQGMYPKKKHEIKALAAVIGAVARTGQLELNLLLTLVRGYLAQVLSFEHELCVMAIVASSHHGSITDARAKRIEKYYAAKLSKSRLQNKGFSRPKTVTCQVLSPAMLKDVSSSLLLEDDLDMPTVTRQQADRNSLAVL